MKSVDTRTGLEWIERDECLRLLAAEEVGRLAVVDGSTPIVLPVNYRMDGDAVVFRTDPGTKLDRAVRGRASFEIDAFDRDRRTGWSVLVVGRVEEVSPYDATTQRRVHQLPVEPWGGGAKDHWLRLVPETISGRRIAHP